MNGGSCVSSRFVAYMFAVGTDVRFQRQCLWASCKLTAVSSSCHVVAWRPVTPLSSRSQRKQGTMRPLVVNLQVLLLEQQPDIRCYSPDAWQPRLSFVSLLVQQCCGFLLSARWRVSTFSTLT
jgi:hypothetical protein